MAYYLVLCKSGHVGRTNTILIWYPVEAESRKEASFIARWIPRVKHDHYDAIVDCKEVDFEDYYNQKVINSYDPYLLCGSRHEQMEIIDLIRDRIIKDDFYGGERKKNSRKPNLRYQELKYQSCYKYYK